MNEKMIFRLNGDQPGQVKKLLDTDEAPFWMELPKTLDGPIVIYNEAGKKLGILKSYFG
jgi:hypothetical protein